MDCAFCAEFTGALITDRVIVTDGDWLLLPTVGAFTPGYCLYMPVDHIDAAADLGRAELHRLEAKVERMRARVASAFGPTVIAEHGSRDCRLGAGCCTHCHLHLIPVPDPGAVAAVYRRTGGPGTPLTGLADLPDSVTGPYLYLSTAPGEHMVWPADDRFTRQYVRRVCAEMHGAGDRYDWRDHPFEGHQRTTGEFLRDTFAGQAV